MIQSLNSQDATEFVTWIYAFPFMLVFSAMLLAVQSLVGPFFNRTFEICVFYVPREILLATMLYWWTKRKGRR